MPISDEYFSVDVPDTASTSGVHSGGFNSAHGVLFVCADRPLWDFSFMPKRTAMWHWKILQEVERRKIITGVPEADANSCGCCASRHQSSRHSLLSNAADVSMYACAWQAGTLRRNLLERGRWVEVRLLRGLLLSAAEAI